MNLTETLSRIVNLPKHDLIKLISGLLKEIARLKKPIKTESTAWHCCKCGKNMQFFDGICFDCNGGEDPGN